jgi:hypothetical protein
MPPDHDHFNGSVNLNDAESVLREIVSPIQVGLRRIPGRETGDQADWISCQVRMFPRLPWLVPARPQPGSLAGLTVDPDAGLDLALVPYRPAGQARGIT